MNEDKAKWCEAISELIQSDPRSGVKQIRYYSEMCHVDGHENEYVQIIFQNDNGIVLNVTGTSQGYILKDIVHHVY